MVLATLTCSCIVEGILPNRKAFLLALQPCHLILVPFCNLGFKPQFLTKTKTSRPGTGTLSLGKWVLKCSRCIILNLIFSFSPGRKFEEEQRKAFQNETLVPESSMHFAGTRRIYSYPMAIDLVGKWRKGGTNWQLHFALRPRKIEPRKIPRIQACFFQCGKFVIRYHLHFAYIES